MMMILLIYTHTHTHTQKKLFAENSSQIDDNAVNFLGVGLKVNSNS